MNHEVIINKNKWVKKGEENSIPVYGLPSQYQVKYQLYEYNDSTKHYWNQMEINVYKDDELYLTIGRNYSFIANPVYAHQNGKDFIITSGDYMCITVINLTDRTVESYTDEESYKKGWAYCPTSFNWWDEETSTLQLEGCVWGGEYEIITFKNVNLENPAFDFSKAEHELDESQYDDYDDEEDDDDENP